MPRMMTTGEPERSEVLLAFGAVLKRLRVLRELTQQEFADRVRFSPATVSSIEQGRRMPPEDFIGRSEAVLEARGVLEAFVPYLSRRRGMPNWYQEWAAMERSALGVYTYESRLLPGILQTPAYIRALLRAVPPTPRQEVIEERVESRLARQELLSTKRDPPTTYGFVIEQSVLDRGFGGVSVAQEQLTHLLDVIRDNWNVSVQIIPRYQPEHAGLDGPVHLMEAADHRWHAYTEGQLSGALISDPEPVSRLKQRYAKLSAQALSESDSKRLIEEMRDAT
ncbi:putative xre family toxin-antitoxin system, antitoxin component [Streptomyces sp. Tu6071]|uniref:helix-turn-helix domain-containing protein n=1 Tax=Streptomyces sp. Tu6071 TaxID=355249 RepID=UPI00020E5ABA|nr:helix-turn-helix transcriptional regulator [Streptomyces sp. Tu6071]EGJ74016.1 putative xre family toxin-antitoxin system, antitoxin component [Streptomyces sp. Tu6071]